MGGKERVCRVALVEGKERVEGGPGKREGEGGGWFWWEGRRGCVEWPW